MADVMLAVSELVTNALLHGSGTIELHIEADDRSVKGEVVDAGRGLEQRIRERGVDGPGLRIVGRVAEKWGVFQGTTHVWFEIPLDRAPAAQVDPTRRPTAVRRPACPASRRTLASRGCKPGRRGCMLSMDERRLVEAPIGHCWHEADGKPGISDHRFAHHLDRRARRRRLRGRRGRARPFDRSPPGRRDPRRRSQPARPRSRSTSTRVTFIDSTGLRALIEAQLRSQQDSNRLRLTRGSPQAQRLFALAAVDQLLPFVDGQ